MGEDVPLGPGKPEPIQNVVHLNFANSKNLSLSNLTVFQQLIESDAFFVINTGLRVNSNFADFAFITFFTYFPSLD